MKRILIISPGTLPYPPIKGGAIENLIHNLVLQNEKEPSFYFVVYTISDEIVVNPGFKFTKIISIDSGTAFYKFNRFYRFVLNKIFPESFPNQFLKCVLKTINNFDHFDYILLENNPHFAKFVSRKSKLPIIIRVHNEIKLDKYFHYFDGCITVSNYLRNQLGSNWQSSFVVYNGIDLKRFNKSIVESEKREIRKSFGVCSSDILVCYSGRIDKTKGINILIDAFLEISDMPNLKLLIIGASKFADSKIIKINEENISDKVIYTGYIDYGEIHNYYKICDFAVLPSIIDEGFGLTVLESIASGLPVIISDSGALPEIVDPNCGIVLSRNTDFKSHLIKSIRMLASDVVLRKKMSFEAKRRSKFFSNSAYFKNFNLYFEQKHES